MSRNLGRTTCAFCDGAITLVEAPRPITPNDAGRYFNEFDRMIVADAECVDCHGKYLAWIDESMRRVHPRYIDSRDQDPPFHDLSFRKSFNDEPALEDWYTVDPRLARARRLRQVATELEDEAVHKPSIWDERRIEAQRSSSMTPEEAKAKIVELLLENKEGSRAVARDIATDFGMVKTATITNVEPVRDPQTGHEYQNTRIVTLDTGERYATFTDVEWIKPGESIDFVLGEEAWATDSDGNKLRQLHPARVFNTDHPYPESLLKRYVNTWWPKDGSAPLKGLGRALGKPIATCAGCGERLMAIEWHGRILMTNHYYFVDRSSDKVAVCPGAHQPPKEP